MSPISKRRSRPEQPDAFTSLMDQLESLLEVEYLFTPHLQLSVEEQEQYEITVSARNGFVNVLRCLKMWYDLPSDVFMTSVNILDRFLTKMKVRVKHMACISVSSLYIASRLLSEHVNPDDLVNISQSKCTSMDLQRMSTIITNKLNLNEDTLPVTGLSFIRCYHRLLCDAADKLDVGHMYENAISEQEYCKHLEIIACDSCCANDLPSVVALVLVFIQLEQFITEWSLDQFFSIKIFKLYTFAVELKTICNVNDHDFSACFERVVSILNLYNGELKIPYRQRLVWKVSNRTMKKLRPTKQLAYVLPTIVEDNSNISNLHSKN